MVPGRLRRILPLIAVLTGVASPAAPAHAQTVAAAEPQAASAPVVASHPPAPQAIDSDRTRFVIGLEHDVEFQVFALSNPNRVIVDIAETKLQLPNDPGGKAIGLVSAFRAGLSGPGKTRVVIDVTEPVVVESSKLEKASDGKGRHLALQIMPVRAIAKASKKPLKSAPFALGAAGLQPPLPQPAQRPNERAAKSFKPIIVIDPGHGGHDSGGEKNGAVEKDVVLAFSLALRKKLEETGRYKVLMTRETDVFVELDERRAFAERNKANLFIAVHSDYAQNKARGATIYSLRESVANALERSAKGEVSEKVLSSAEVEKVKKASGGEDLDTVKTILADLATREVDATKERTNVFSRTVIEYMGETTNLREEPEQQAAFRVLKTAQFPSVLIELAYITNKEDAEQLKSEAWREKVSDSITTAVDNYFSNQIARLPM